MSSNRWFGKQDAAHKYNGTLSACSVYLAIKKNEMLPFSSTWMGLEVIALSQLERQRQISHNITYMWNLKWKVKSLSRVQLFVTLWTVVYRTTQSMEFSRQEYWSGLPFPSPGEFPNPGIKPRSPALQADTLLSEPPGKPHWEKIVLLNYCTDGVRALFLFLFSRQQTVLWRLCPSTCL